MGKKVKVLHLILVLSLATIVGVSAQDYSPDSLSMKVYSDGGVDVEYVIEPDTTLAQVNVSLIGEEYQDIIVLDQDGIILDWSLNQGEIMIDTLGSTTITITYTTYSLTDKTGTQWSVGAESETNLVYTLPKGAVLTGLIPSPVGISVVDNQATITMPVGVSSISYLIGTTGTQENALVLLNKAKADVSDALADGLVIDEAETLLIEAIQAYQNQQYTLSEQYSEQVSELIEETEAQAADALTQINAAESIIASRRDQIDIATIKEAETALEQAQTKYDQGLYSEAFVEAENTYNLVLNAPDEEQNGNQTLLYGAVIIVVLVVAGYLYINQQKRGMIQKPDTKQPKVDLDAVFDENPNLRTDDKAVLRYLEETGGVFITEIRDHFDIPKSSAWRMVRRLEENGFISTSMVGGETYLQLKAQEEEQ